MNTVKRYEWLDALVDAQKAGLISNGALLLCTKLSKAIQWSPKDGRPAGLYWKNATALKEVGASRATYFKYRQSLFETGFLTEIGGNLIPLVPEVSLVETVEDEEVSLVETEQSLVKTEESLVETQESLGDNPYSVDILPVDVLSEDDEVLPPAAGSSSGPSLNNEQVKATFSSITGPDGPLNTLRSFIPGPLRSDDEWLTEREEAAESLLETPAELAEWLDTREAKAKESPTYSKSEWEDIRRDALRRFNDGVAADRAVDFAMAAVVW